MMQIGLWSSSYFTIATGAHTCTSLVFRARQVPWVNSVCIALGWIISLVVGEHVWLRSLNMLTGNCLALVPHVKDNIYGPDGISCGVIRQYHVEYLLLQSLPVRPFGLSARGNCSKTTFADLLGHCVLWGNILSDLLRSLREARSRERCP